MARDIFGKGGEAMPEKDALEKKLLDFTDVFADIWNVLVFGGQPVIAEEELADALPRSIYKADGKVHEQERDVAKFWKKNQLRIALIGVENQTDTDSDLPLRVIGYDGAAYRAQLNADKKGESKVRYPVVTIVLYFGFEKHWNTAQRLKECFDIPDALDPFVNDYPIHVVEVAWLSEETIKKLKSDFRVVAKFFQQARLHHEKGIPFQPMPDVVRHVDEVLALLSIVAGDDRIWEAAKAWNEKEESDMGLAMLDEIEERGEKRGLERGKEIGKEIGTETTWISSIRNLMKSMKMTAQEAADALAVPQNLRKKVLEQV